MGNFPKSILGIILVITFLLLNIVVDQVHSETLEQFQYPKVRRDESIVDDYHGTNVKDPYRWLEERDAEAVSKFVGAQNEFTSTYLNDCKQRSQFKESLEELWSYPKYGLAERRGNRYFYFAQQRGGEVLHVQENKTSIPRPLIDPQINGILTFPSFGVSKDGELVAYKEVVRVEGFPRITGNLRILNVSSGDVFPDIVENIQAPAVAWDKDSRGFFYSSHTKNDESSEEDEETRPKFNVYYHKVGTKQEKDVLAVDYADFGDDPYFVDMEMSVDGQFLLLKTRAYDGGPPKPKTKSTFYIVNLTKFQESGGGSAQRLQLVPVVTKRTTTFFVKYVGNIGPLFYFRSRIGHKNYQLIEIDLANPSEDKWRVIVDENTNYILQGATIVDKSKVVLSYTSEKLNFFAELRDLQNGSLIRIFPLEFGELLSFSGNIDDSEVLFRSTKLEGLPELFYFDVRDPRGPMKRLVQQPTLSRYDPSQFVAEVVTYPSLEGDNVEMILLYRKGLKRDGSSYAIITEREFDLDFYFRIYFSYMKDFNLVVAFPHLEEGKTGRSGEFRDSALDDFIAAAEYLIQHGYSNGSRIIARGQNTFGLFLASAVNRRPQLFGAAVPSLVAFDMLRYDIVANSTQDLGLLQDVEEFNRTFGISPLHNIHVNEIAQYPGIFIPTPNEYPVPLAYKYLAELQHSLGSDKRQTKPFLIRVVPEVGVDAFDIGLFSKYHIERETDIRCFLEKTIGLSYVNE